MKATGSFANQTLVEIEGNIANTGDRAHRRHGDLLRVLRYLRAVGVSARACRSSAQRMGGLKPGETKSFRLPFDEIPG